MNKTKFIPIASLSYNYVPTSLFRPKALWITLKAPPPYDLKVNSIVKLHIPGNSQLKTIDNGLFFLVNDIIGTRVILSLPEGSQWNPIEHYNCSSPFGWEYNTQIQDSEWLFHNINYGYGITNSLLEYVSV